MRVSADIGRAALTVALDVRHPLAYLALQPAIDLARETGVSVDWLPLAAEPLRRPTVPGPDDDRGIRHRRHRAGMIAREVAVYAQAQGLVVKEPYRSAPAEAVHLGWLWMRATDADALPPFLVEAFRRYWTLELDAGDVEDVARVVDACGGDAAGFRGWAASEGREVAETVAAELVEAGIFSVPAYRVEDEVFYGRQHLPMIRWLLGGRRGRGPI